MPPPTVNEDLKTLAARAGQEGEVTSVPVTDAIGLFRGAAGAMTLGWVSFTNLQNSIREATTDLKGLLSTTLWDKLDGIETAATADQTGAEIKSAYEGEANTNAFTDADESKLDAIEAAADVTDETNVTAAFPVSAATSLVKDPADGTKQARLDVGAVAPGTTRVVTLPNSDLDLTPASGSFASAAQGATADAAQVGDATLTALAGLGSGANKLPYFDGVDSAVEADLTAFAITLLDDANAAAGRTTLGVVIGTDVQAQDAELAALAGLTSAADKLPYFTGSGTASLADLTVFARTILDDANAVAVRTTISAASAAQGSTAETALQSVDDDTSPTLGGPLDVGANAIVSSTAGDIAITPDTTGDVLLDGQKWPQADGTIGQVLQTNGSAQLSWATLAGGGDFLADGTIPMTGDIDLDGNNLDDGGVIFQREQAAADVDVPGQGQTWVLTATPNVLMFTDDAGTDFTIANLAATQTFTNKDISNANNTYRAASATVVGAAELATAAETTTGTDAARVVTPDGLAGSDHGKKVVSILLNQTTALAAGDGKGYWRVPSTLSGYNLVEVGLARLSGTGALTVQVHNLTQTANMLSTELTIDSGETDSSTAEAAAVIDTANDDVASYDRIRFDVDDAGTATLWCEVQLVFQTPG